MFFLTFINKRLINGIHKMFKKHSIINGFHTHLFLTFAKRFLSNICKTQKCLPGNIDIDLGIANKPWKSLYVDFCGLIEGKMFF